MRHSKAFLPLSLASLGAAEIVGQWTAWSLARTCTPEGSSCTYHLVLVPGPESDFITCDWTVDSTSNFKPAYQTNFAEAKCGDNLSLNGGWSSMGFITIVPTDKAANVYAFFGFTDAELADGQVASSRQRPAYRVGTFGEKEHPDLGLGMSKKMVRRLSRGFVQQHGGSLSSSKPTKEKRRDITMSDQLRKHISVMYASSQQQKSSSEIDTCSQNCQPSGDDYDALACVETCRQQLHGPKINNGQERHRLGTRNDNPETWQIHSLTRLTNHLLNQTLFTFSLYSSTTLQLAKCSISIPSVEPTHSWYGQRCDKDGKFSVGWGYKADTDSAVMTVCERGRGMAWFGWDGVAERDLDLVEVRFGDSRGEVVHETVCT
ncbi:hypothetical protein QC764_202810 [Podospora pseudoanserina]|uniref:Uncharacterized protein n=1 Tax=Podospora pseudoanserina TaxID=2609844 RepID=A0ABR0IHG7_9PEZI|nr:hypothetical protein QC764_202810 [Podospora pseudoanserina]